MTRFAWLQSRTQTLTVAAVLAALAVAAAVTGVQLSHLYNSLVAHCHTGCDLATSQFLSHDHFMDHALNILAQAVPALIGIFWGAPLLAREFETGTYRLAWTQSVTRSRWLITKLAIGGLATATVAGLLTLTITWWYRALDTVSTNQYAVFDRRDIAPIGYAAFAFAVGALAGAVIRRTLPAMATTLGVYVFALIATTLWVRPHLLAPVHKTVSLLGAGPSAPVQLGVGSRNGGALTLFAQGEGPAKSWTLSSHLLTSSGQKPSSAQISAFLHQYCPNAGLPPAAPQPGQGVARVVGPDAGRACLDQAAKMFHLLVTYQPASRYWTFQWLETGIFVALALLAAAVCYWWVIRRTN
ncbi:MAG: transporter [Actinomycetota bacterium]|nr:transporter [Actinomycetota bacterium]